MARTEVLSTGKFDESLDKITASLRSFIDLSLQEDDKTWGEWIASIAGHVEVRCWEKKNCRNSDCPAYKSECGRCWLLVGSLCSSNRQSGDQAEPHNCRECEIYLLNVCKDSFIEIREQIITLVHNLRSRQQELKEMAIHDPLTGLKNRRFFDMYIPHEVERVNRSKESLAVVVIDVNDFKNINDAHGHLAGDRILKDCADILHGSIRGTDLLFRFGGDEFLIVMSRAGEHEAEVVINRINQQLAAWNGSRNGQRSQLSFSIGYSLLTHTRELYEVMSEADLRMYEDKRRWKGLLSQA
ncbi:MAG: GGDEF domain-containing protein [Desulfobulbaceae bacterium]|nr:GGDEF domain-containing protein [Desulfobulbaceae bacterium]